MRGSPARCVSLGALCAAPAGCSALDWRHVDLPARVVGVVESSDWSGWRRIAVGLAAILDTNDDGEPA